MHSLTVAMVGMGPANTASTKNKKTRAWLSIEMNNNFTHLRRLYTNINYHNNAYF